MKKNIVVFTLFLLAAVGCTTTQQGTTIGGASGAVLGGIIGHQSGHDVTGAAIGAAAGAVGGYVVGDKMSGKMFCPTCGKVYPEGTKYCAVDGTALKVQQK